MSVITVLSICTSISLLAIWAIIIWFVCPWIQMSDRATMIVRALVVAVAIMASLSTILSASARGSVSPPDYAPTPSIIAPERQHH
jgi:hypothetical protein